MLARVLVAPAFLYRVEKPGPGAGQRPVSDWELASRLSYFLWSSLPDAELRELAAAGRLHDPDVAGGPDPADAARPRKCGGWRPSLPASGCTSTTSTTSTKRASSTFPTFVGLRGAMYEESIRFFTDLFQNDGSVLGILDADHTFLNESWRKHYGIPGVTGAEWRRVDGVKQFGRGGILGPGHDAGQAIRRFAHQPDPARQLGQRSLLGERLPRPPKDVPQLPEDEAATEGLTVRQLVEKHTSDAEVRGLPSADRRLGLCAGRLRRHRPPPRQGPGRPADRHPRQDSWTAPSSTDSTACGITCSPRREAFLRQFCRKLLGYPWAAPSSFPTSRCWPTCSRAESQRLQVVPRHRNDRPQPPIPRNSRPRNRV